MNESRNSTVNIIPLILTKPPESPIADSQINRDNEGHVISADTRLKQNMG